MQSKISSNLSAMGAERFIIEPMGNFVNKSRRSKPCYGREEGGKKEDQWTYAVKNVCGAGV